MKLKALSQRNLHCRPGIECCGRHMNKVLTFWEVAFILCLAVRSRFTEISRSLHISGCIHGTCTHCYMSLCIHGTCTHCYISLYKSEIYIKIFPNLSSTQFYVCTNSTAYPSVSSLASSTPSKPNTSLRTGMILLAVIQI